jgi:hypothetical protein
MVHMIQGPQFMLKLFFAPSGRGCTIYTYISCHIALVMIFSNLLMAFLKFNLGCEYSQNQNIIPI